MVKVNLIFLPDFHCLHLPAPIRKQSVVKSISMFSLVPQFPNHKDFSSEHVDYSVRYNNSVLPDIYVRVIILFTRGKHMYDRIISPRGEIIKSAYPLHLNV